MLRRGRAAEASGSRSWCNAPQHGFAHHRPEAIADPCRVRPVGRCIACSADSRYPSQPPREKAPSSAPSLYQSPLEVVPLPAMARGSVTAAAVPAAFNSGMPQRRVPGTVPRCRVAQAARSLGPSIVGDDVQVVEPRRGKSTAAIAALDPPGLTSTKLVPTNRSPATAATRTARVSPNAPSLRTSLQAMPATPARLNTVQEPLVSNHYSRPAAPHRLRKPLQPKRRDRHARGVLGSTASATVSAYGRRTKQTNTSEPTVTPELIGILAVGATLAGLLLGRLRREARADIPSLAS